LPISKLTLRPLEGLQENLTPFLKEINQKINSTK
jgi:hypothetical protein